MDDVGDASRLTGGKLSVKLQVIRARLKKAGAQHQSGVLALTGAANIGVSGSQHQQPAASGTLMAPSSPGTSSSDRDGRLKPPPAQRRQLQPARQVVPKAAQSAQQRILRGVRAAGSSVRVQSPQAELPLSTVFAAATNSGSPSGPPGGTSAPSAVAGVTSSSSVGSGRDFDAPMSFEELMRRKREREQQQQEVAGTTVGTVSTSIETKAAVQSPVDSSQRRQVVHSSEGLQHQLQTKTEIMHVQSNIQQAAVPLTSNAGSKSLPTTSPGTIRSVQARDQPPVVAASKVAVPRQATEPQKGQLQRQKQEAPCLQRTTDARQSPPPLKASGETRTQKPSIDAKAPAVRVVSGVPVPKQHQKRVSNEPTGGGEPSTRSLGVVASVPLPNGATGTSMQVKVPAAPVPKVCASNVAARQAGQPARASEKPSIGTLQVAGATSSSSGVRNSAGQASRSQTPLLQKQSTVQQATASKVLGAPKAPVAPQQQQQRPGTVSTLQAAAVPTLTVSRSGVPPPAGAKVAAPVKGLPSNLENNDQNLLCDRLALEQTAFAPLRSALWPWGCGPPNVLAKMLQEIARAADCQVAAAALDASSAVAAAVATASNEAEVSEDPKCRVVETGTGVESLQQEVKRPSSAEPVSSSPFEAVANFLRLIAEQASSVPKHSLSVVKVANEAFPGGHLARAPSGQELCRLSPEAQAEALEKLASVIQQELKRCDLQMVEVTGKRLFSAAAGETQPQAEEAALRKKTRSTVAAVSVARA